MLAQDRRLPDRHDATLARLRRVARLAATAALAASLAACGVKGPLKLPSPAPEAGTGTSPAAATGKQQKP